MSDQRSSPGIDPDALAPLAIPFGIFGIGYWIAHNFILFLWILGGVVAVGIGAYLLYEKWCEERRKINEKFAAKRAERAEQLRLKQEAEASHIEQQNRETERLRKLAEAAETERKRQLAYENLVREVRSKGQGLSEEVILEQISWMSRKWGL